MSTPFPVIADGLRLNVQALRALRIPVLVTHGARNRLFPIGMSRYIIDAVPGSWLSIYPNVGHSPFMEDSRRFNAELKALAAMG